MNEVADAVMPAVPPHVTERDGLDASMTPIEAYRRDFEAARSSSREPKWLRDLRRAGIERFESGGFPSMRDEDWHFTSVAPIAERVFNGAPEGAPLPPEVVDRFGYGQSWHTSVFINGRLSIASRAAAPPAGVNVGSLADAIENDAGLFESRFGRLESPDAGAFTALNTALARDGAVIRIAADAVIEKPIHLLLSPTRALKIPPCIPGIS